MTMAMYEAALKGNGMKEMKSNLNREHLKTISNTVKEMARAAGRTKVSINQLLRETYNLVNVDLDTFDGWAARGASVKKGQHAYMFWGAPVTTNEGYSYCPINYLFAPEQVCGVA